MASQRKAKLSPNVRTWFVKEDWKERIVTFDPSWYLVCMGTGIIIQLTASNFPYPTGWLRRLGYTFWILDIVLFSFFTLMSLARLCCYPKIALGVFKDFQQTCYLGAIPIAFETIDTGLVIFYSHHGSAVYVAQVFFWIAVVMSLLVACGGILAMYRNQGQHKLNEVTGVWLLVFIPSIVVAALGSTLALTVSLKNEAVVLTVSFLMVSLGLGCSFLVLGIYLWRLMACQLPARDAIASTFVPVGPLSMAAYVIANLSKVLSQYIVREQFSFRQSWESNISPASIAAISEMIIWIGVIIALFLLGVGTFFLIEAFASVSMRVPKSFNIGLWSFVFPCGVYANAWCLLSTLLRNEAMKGWAATCVVGTILIWLMCAVCTTYKAVWQGKLFFAPGLFGWSEESELKKVEDKSSQADKSPSPPHPIPEDIKADEGLVKRRPGSDGTYARQKSGSLRNGNHSSKSNV